MSGILAARIEPVPTAKAPPQGEAVAGARRDTPKRPTKSLMLAPVPALNDLMANTDARDLVSVSLNRPLVGVTCPSWPTPSSDSDESLTALI
jgi:hypothetical protein